MTHIDDNLLRTLVVVARKLRTVFDARVRARGLTYSRARLLLHLVQFPQATQAELADALEVEPPTMARLIDSMEKAGLVLRETCASDRRIRRITLTPEAETHAREMLKMVEDLRRDALVGVAADDIAAADRVMRAVLENLSKEG